MRVTYVVPLQPRFFSWVKPADLLWRGFVEGNQDEQRVHILERVPGRDVIAGVEGAAAHGRMFHTRGDEWHLLLVCGEGEAQQLAEAEASERGPVQRVLGNRSAAPTTIKTLVITESDEETNCESLTKVSPTVFARGLMQSHDAMAKVVAANLLLLLARHDLPFTRENREPLRLTLPSGKSSTEHREVHIPALTSAVKGAYGSLMLPPQVAQEAEEFASLPVPTPTSPTTQVPPDPPPPRLPAFSTDEDAPDVSKYTRDLERWRSSLTDARTGFVAVVRRFHQDQERERLRQSRKTTSDSENKGQPRRMRLEEIEVELDKYAADVREINTRLPSFSPGSDYDDLWRSTTRALREAGKHRPNRVVLPVVIASLTVLLGVANYSVAMPLESVTVVLATGVLSFLLTRSLTIAHLDSPVKSIARLSSNAREAASRFALEMTRVANARATVLVARENYLRLMAVKDRVLNRIAEADYHRRYRSGTTALVERLMSDLHMDSQSATKPRSGTDEIVLCNFAERGDQVLSTMVEVTGTPTPVSDRALFSLKLLTFTDLPKGSTTP